MKRRIRASVLLPVAGILVYVLATTGETITLPILGELSLEDQSIFVSTVLIGFIDGFNPCSLWVLTVLLGLVIHAGRRKALLVGGTFLAVTATIYGLFIVGVLSVFDYVAHIEAIRIVVALFALAFAVVSIKEYVAFDYGPSFSIPDSRKPGMYRRMREAVQTDGVVSTVVATAVMAGGIALVELPCTAGFPIVWSNLVAVHDPSTTVYAGLVAVYVATYLSVELVLFVFAVATMTRIEYGKSRGRLLKLLAGVVLLALAAALVFRPEILESITETVLLFTAAMIVTASIAALDRLTGWFTGGSVR